MPEEPNPLRSLPQVQRLLEMPPAQTLILRFGRAPVTEALRQTLEALRAEISAGTRVSAPEAPHIIVQAGERLTRRHQCGLRRTINATGIVLHTNLGRAPLAADAVAAITRIANGYCNLEFDLETGRRGSRTQAVETLLCDLTSAEGALAVNNGAAAILLTLSALGAGGEVIVSRGELVEIGGGFRVPDVIRQGGARLVEVGATNKTRLRDYQSAISPETRVLLKVHQSNFRTIGFTAQTEIAELSELSRAHRLLLVADLGSGLLTASPGQLEPTLRQALTQGADVVTCSGDKLLGGPQAGLILGRASVVDRLRQHPLLRALRLDKLSLAALEVTLMLHRDDPQRIPVAFMLSQSQAQVQQRAEQLLRLLGTGRIEHSFAFAGGGSLPEERLASCALMLEPDQGPESMSTLLRQGDPAVVGRIHDGQLVLDLFTVSDGEVTELAEQLRRMLA